jgi:hypothetical protein
LRIKDGKFELDFLSITGIPALEGDIGGEQEDTIQKSFHTTK